MKELDLDFEQWKSEYRKLLEIENKINNSIKNNLLSKEEKIEIKKLLDEKWIELAEKNPHKSESIKNTFIKFD